MHKHLNIFTRINLVKPYALLHMAANNAQWVMKDHTAVKHKILSEYLERWLAILGRPDREGKPRMLHYVDTHAGRGRYEGGEVGSPIIAAQKGEELHQHYGTVYLSCHNIEEDTANFTNLKHEIAQVQPTCPSVELSIYQGDFRALMPQILGRIPAAQAALIFIDPFGYSDLALHQVLEYLKGRRYHELVITFMSQFISRFMSDKDKHETLDVVLDTTEWRRLIGVTDSEIKLVDMYAQRLQKAGSELSGQRVFAYPIKLQIPRGRSPYYLIHVSQHPKGRLAMEAAVHAANTSRSLSSEALPLFTTVEIEQAIISSVNRHPGISTLKIAGELWKTNISATWQNDIRLTIQRLSGGGVLTIKDKNGSTRNVGVLPAESDKIFSTGNQQREIPLF